MNTILHPAGAKITRQRSRFVALAEPIHTTAEVGEALAGLKRVHHAARHIPYAYRLSSGEWRASDDGEPAGSAGRPILSAIEADHLVNVLVAVARYYGGVKLGVGGLSRAYRDAAREAISGAGRCDLVPQAHALLVTSMENVGDALAQVARLGGKVLGQRFAERAEVEFVLPEAQLPHLLEAVAPWGEVREVGDA